MARRRRSPGPKRWLVALAAAALVLALARTRPVSHAALLWRYRHAPVEMLVPVDGLRAAELRSSWHAPRPGGRKHEGADLFAPRGTPVRSAVDGTVVRVGPDRLGGQVVWVLGEGRTLYYYAHLHRFAPGLAVGLDVRRGDVLGQVGNTGNARTTPPHLHFGMYRVGLTGLTAVDPVPQLVRHQPRLPGSS